MTIDELNHVESALNIKLPSDYRRWALQMPCHNSVHDTDKELIAINDGFRSGMYGDTNWDHQLFAYAHDGAGNYYCLKTDGKDGPIFFRDHETLTVKLEQPSFQAWLSWWQAKGNG